MTASRAVVNCYAGCFCCTYDTDAHLTCIQWMWKHILMQQTDNKAADLSRGCIQRVLDNALGMSFIPPVAHVLWMTEASDHREILMG